MEDLPSSTLSPSFKREEIRRRKKILFHPGDPSYDNAGLTRDHHVSEKRKLNRTPEPVICFQVTVSGTTTACTETGPTECLPGLCRSILARLAGLQGVANPMKVTGPVSHLCQASDFSKVTHCTGSRDCHWWGTTSSIPDGALQPPLAIITVRDSISSNGGLSGSPGC